MTYQGIIFDFNGVLLWDTVLQEQSWKEFSAWLRGYPLTDDEMRDHMHGRSNRDVQEYLTGKTLSPETVDELTERKEAIYKNLCLAQGDAFQLAPSAVPFLEFLTRENIPHTIATASERGNVDFFIQHLHLGRWFDLDALVYDDGTFPCKPAPDIYRIAAQKIGLPPGVCVVMEDSLAGIAAAHRAGIGGIWAVSTANPPELLRKQPGVTAVVPDFTGLEQYF